MKQQSIFGEKHKLNLLKYIGKTTFKNNVYKSKKKTVQNRGNVIYFLGNIGFGASIIIGILHFIHLKDKKIMINDMYWNSKCEINKGIKCYFSDKSLLSKSINNKKKLDDKTLITYESFNVWIEDEKLYFQIQTINAIGYIMNKDKDVPKNKWKDELKKINKVFNKFWILNDNVLEYIKKKCKEIKLPKKYIGIHVRMGDKIGKYDKDYGKSIREANFPLLSKIEKRIKNILKKDKNIKTIFVATDDYRAVEMIKNILKLIDINILTFATEKRKGYNQKDFNKKDINNIYDDTLNFLLDLDVLMNSTYYFGTTTSNISKLVLFSNKIPLNRFYNMENNKENYKFKVQLPPWLKRVATNQV